MALSKLGFNTKRSISFLSDELGTQSKCSERSYIFSADVMRENDF